MTARDTEDARPEERERAEAEAHVGTADRRRWLTPRTRRRLLTGGVAALLLAAGAWMLAGAYRLTSAPSADNRALTDTERTSQVSGEVSDALAKVFSYTPDRLSTTEQDARQLLDGRAARQYEELFGQLRQQVRKQELTLTTQVVEAGVTRLSQDRAQLLVFLDQTSRRAGKKPATAAAQLSVTAERQDGDWRIVRLKSR